MLELIIKSTLNVLVSNFRILTQSKLLKDGKIEIQVFM
jgi:hypothetical protein